MTKKNILSLFLAVIMVIGMIPATAFATDPNYVAKNTTTDKMYETLFEAIDAAADGNTIQLMDDYTIETDQYTVYKMPENSTLDLSGNTLTIPFATAMFAGKNFTIKNGTITPPSDKNQDYALFIGSAVEATDEIIETSAIVDGVNVVKGGINIRYGSEATIRNCDVTVNPNRKYYAVYAEVDSNVTVENGSYTGGKNEIDVYAATNATLEVLGGTFANGVDDKYLPEGYVLEDNGNGTYTVLNTNFVAEVDGTKYLTLLEAVNVAQAGDTIKLIDDCSIALGGETNEDRTITLPSGVTIDLNGNTLTVPFQQTFFAGNDITIKNGTLTTGALENYVLYIMNGSFTVKDVTTTNGINVQAGTVTLENVDATCPNKYYAVYAGAEADVTINSGRYKTVRNANNLYADGKITVYGGTFDKNLMAAENATIEVLGGRFKNDPSKYVPFGYGVTQDAGYYTVTETPNARRLTVVADKDVAYVDDTVTVEIKIDGTNMSIADYTFEYDTDIFTCDADTGSDGKISYNTYKQADGDVFASGEVLATYTLKVKAQQTDDVETTLSLSSDSKAGNDSDSTNGIGAETELVNDTVTIKFKTLDMPVIKVDNQETTDTSAEIHYDEKTHTFEAATATEGAKVEYTVTFEGDVSSINAIKEIGTYEITYTITKDGYTPITGNFTIEITNPLYEIEIVKDYVKGKVAVLVYTNVTDVCYNYDGNLMIDVTAKNYTYNGTPYARVFGYVTDPLTDVNGDNTLDKAVYAAKLGLVKPIPEVLEVIAVDYDLDVNPGFDQYDINAAYGVYNVRSAYFTNANAMKIVLKADISCDKVVDDVDTVRIYNAFYNPTTTD